MVFPQDIQVWRTTQEQFAEGLMTSICYYLGAKRRARKDGREKGRR